jgi:hypothetical protein
VTSDAGTGKQIEAEPQELGTPTEDILSFTDYLVQEKDLVNLVSSGREFYGEEFNSSKLTYNYSYALPNVLDSTATFRLSVAANSQLLSTFVAKINNTTIGSLSVQSMANAPVYEHAKTSVTSPAFYFEPVPTNQLNVSLTYSNANGQAWLNFFELNVKRLLKLTNDVPLFFRNVDSLNVDKIRRFVVQGASSSTQVWNVSDPLNIKRVPATLTDDKITFAVTEEEMKAAITQSAGSIAISVKNDFQKAGLKVTSSEVLINADRFKITDGNGANAGLVFEWKNGKPMLRTSCVDVDSLKVKHLDGADGTFSGTISANGAKIVRQERKWSNNRQPFNPN